MCGQACPLRAAAFRRCEKLFSKIRRGLCNCAKRSHMPCFFFFRQYLISCLLQPVTKLGMRTSLGHQKFFPTSKNNPLQNFFTFILLDFFQSEFPPPFSKNSNLPLLPPLQNFFLLFILCHHKPKSFMLPSSLQK